MTKFYVTTPIYYINDVPSLGSAYPTIIADILARWHRLRGDDVFFLTGLDENSVKTVQAAKKLGVKDIKSYADGMAEKWKSAFKNLNISNDDFIRTTEERHKKNVLKVFDAVYKKGDIYKGRYEGLYCEGCEAYYKESDLVNGCCPLHKKEPKLISEENYFFKLSKYQSALLEHIEKNPKFIEPESRRNEIRNFIKKGLEDISISRPNLEWGILLPIDKSQIIWVWFDALSNYLLPEKYWPADVHIVGKDIARFHCIIWPSMLLSAGIELPKKVYAHGFFTIAGQKMSKSLGNVIDPVYLANKYSTDALRYFLIREIVLGEDGDFSEGALKARLNNELVANYGNLFYRVTSFVEKNFGAVPEPKEFGDAEKDLQKKLVKTFDEVEKLMEEIKLTDALRVIMGLSGEANRYFQEKEPWKNIKEDRESVATTLYFATNLVKAISVLLYPFTPEKSGKALEALNVKIPKWSEAVEFTITPDHKIKAEILYKKVD